MRWFVTSASGALAAAPILLSAYQGGPVPAVTGGFGEPTCAQCHQGTAPGPRDGKLTLEAPRTYRAGETYQLRVTLVRRNLQVGGFEIAARFQTQPAGGVQAGTLRAVDPRTQIVTGGAKGVQYAQHTDAGSRAAPLGKLAWVVEWRAPDKPTGPVVFHVAANAANGDASPLGDVVHTAQAVARVESGAR
jgi:hypothetical protein